jgi:Fe-S-cluster containining protein
MEINSSNKTNFNNETDNVEEEEQKDEVFPQYLCKTCGRCCKSITTSYTYEQLKEMAEEGQEEAKVFIEIFKTYSSIEEARKVDPDQIDQVLSVLKDNEAVPLDQVTFYYCPNLTDENKCSFYEQRPGCCRRAPKHGWSAMPPGCGFEGWQFEQREKHKKMVRIIKEHLYMVECLSPDGKVPGRDMTVEEFRTIIQKKIEPWKKFGSELW